MKECQLQSFYSVSQCAAWCLHKSLWLNYSGESTHILYDNPWRIAQLRIPQPAANLPRGSECGQVGPDDWETQTGKSSQFCAWSYYSVSRSIDIELTYLPYILYHLTATLRGMSLLFWPITTSILFSFCSAVKNVKMLITVQRGCLSTAMSAVPVKSGALQTKS